jgi:hypothetical protein
VQFFQGIVPKNLELRDGHHPAHREQHIPELYGYLYATYFPAHPEPRSKPPIETYLPSSQSPKMKKQQPRDLLHSKIKTGSLAKYLICNTDAHTASNI